MAMDLKDRVVKRCNRPWVFDRRADYLSSNGKDQRDLVPWEARRWYLDIGGQLRFVEQIFDGDVEVGRHSPIPTGSVEYSMDEVEDTFVIAEQTGCTIAEAAIAAKGARAFAPDYIDRVMNSRTQWLAGAEKSQRSNKVIDGTKWEDPRESVPARKTRGKGRKTRGKARAKDQAESPAFGDEIKLESPPEE